MTREPSGCSLCLSKGWWGGGSGNSNAPDPLRLQSSYRRGPQPHSLPSQGRSEGLPLREDSRTHLSEERGCPSFCHLAWGSWEVSSAQKSCTSCPRAAWTREGSEPVRLILEGGR